MPIGWRAMPGSCPSVTVAARASSPASARERLRQANTPGVIGVVTTNTSALRLPSSLADDRFPAARVVSRPARLAPTVPTLGRGRR